MVIMQIQTTHFNSYIKVVGCRHYFDNIIIPVFLFLRLELFLLLFCKSNFSAVILAPSCTNNFIGNRNNGLCYCLKH